ncbi:MAG: hypothetical protein OXM58_10660 [Rhodospirillaceae bacterium]|nr:hypothetical protein [Rhodospirillaceae bacterium]MDE0617315.1 hypothetical protein [Rhodospirillaceae bacterium]
MTLQKIGSEKDFPAEPLREKGYESAFLGRISGSDLGVAILSHRDLPKPETRVRQLPGAGEKESRFLTVDIGGLWVSSVYAPYGPKSLGHEKAIERRVAWLNRLRDHVRDRGCADRDSLLCGDFNVKVRADGPLEKNDRWYSEDERGALEELMGLGFVDLYRAAHPRPDEMPGCTHSYSETRPDGASRLHLVLASKSLAQRLRSACVDVESRPWPRRDAPPVVAEFRGAGSAVVS